MSEQRTDIATRYDGFTAVDLYGKPDNLTRILAEIRESAAKVDADVSTPGGRKAIASTAHKVARLKTHFDGLGKELVAGRKSEIRMVDAERKRLRDELDTLKAEIRKPLTDFEEMEAERVADVRRRIETITAIGTGAHSDGVPMTAEETRVQRANLEAHVVDAEQFAEFELEAMRAKESAAASLDSLIASRQKAEDDAAELAKLQAEKAAREQQERDDRIRREAAESERNRAEAEAKEKAEAEKRKRQAEIDKARRAEAEAKAEAERARLEGELAVKRERERVEAERIAEESKRAKLAENKRHQSAVKNAAVSAIVSASGVSLDQAVAIYDAILGGDVPRVSVTL